MLSGKRAVGGAILTRRWFCTFPLTLAGCSASGVDGGARFVFENGVGRRVGGPALSQYRGIDGSFPRATRANWWQTLYSVDSYSRLDEVFPASISKAPPASSPLRRRARELVVSYDGAAVVGAGRFDLDGYMDRNPSTGLLVVRDGEILAERYQYGRHERHRLTSFSMAKTIIALLIGVAIADGRISSIEISADAVVPELAGTEYGATPLRHLLTMSSGVAFREDYDGHDDSARLSQLTLGEQSAGGHAVPPNFNRRTAEAGTRWYYASAETFVLALVLRRTIGRPIAEYFAEKVWQPMGAEADATWLKDRSGQEVGYMGFNATLRDYGRLAMLMANGGVAQGKQLVPRTWIADMTRSHFSGSQTGRWFGYGFQTWIFPDGSGNFALLGVRGQAIFVDPERKLALVHTAVRPDARDRGGADLGQLWRGIKNAI
jgi:CubicO group peptidase (beta-lactamase class C family)